MAITLPYSHQFILFFVILVAYSFLPFFLLNIKNNFATYISFLVMPLYTLQNISCYVSLILACYFSLVNNSIVLSFTKLFTPNS